MPCKCLSAVRIEDGDEGKYKNITIAGGGKKRKENESKLKMNVPLQRVNSLIMTKPMDNGQG